MSSNKAHPFGAGDLDSEFAALLAGSPAPLETGSHDGTGRRSGESAASVRLSRSSASSRDAASGGSWQSDCSWDECTPLPAGGTRLLDHGRGGQRKSEVDRRIEPEAANWCTRSCGPTVARTCSSRLFLVVARLPVGYTEPPALAIAFAIARLNTVLGVPCVVRGFFPGATAVRTLTARSRCELSQTRWVVSDLPCLRRSNQNAPRAPRSLGSCACGTSTRCVCPRLARL